MNYTSLSEQVKQYSLGVFSDPGSRHLPYHDLMHTAFVVKSAIQIGNHYQLNDNDFFIVTTAAWFHDMGYLTGDPPGHEQRGAAAAAEFLKGLEVDEATIGSIRGCILATRLPPSPTNLLEEIVCDADFFHLGTDDFEERSKLMRKECMLLTPVSKDDWRRGNIKLLQSHRYHTDYCKLLLNKKKQENLDKLLQKEKKAADEKSATTDETVTEQKTATVEMVPAGQGVVIDSNVATLPPATPVVVLEEPAKKKKKKKDKDDRPDKGIETMFRVASTNHQRLSDMSDNKAHIMISVNSIIISVIIGLVVRKIDATSINILVPTLVLLTGSVAAIVFAVLATRPKIPDGTFSQTQVDNQTVNLLFFGNFYKMEFGDYYDGMLKVMANRDFLYGSLIRDIYSQGKVLGNKYKLLRISYTIFMFTLILSIIAFGISTIFFV